MKVISFDVVGTLVDYSYENHIWNEAIPHLYARNRGITIEEAKDYVLREYEHVGRKDIRWYLPEFWFKHFNLSEDPGHVFRLHADKVRFYTEVPSVLRNLSQKYDLVIVSGATRNAIETMVERFKHYFKQIYSSASDRQEAKKTPRFYEVICKTLKSEPPAMAHVGDEWYSDFVSPRRIGINSYYLDRTGEKKGKFVIKDLTELEDRLTVERERLRANTSDC